MGSADNSEGKRAPTIPADVATQLAEAAQRMGVAVAIEPGLDSDAPRLNIPSSGRYTLGAEIGSGGGGRVLLATDRDLRRSVALKVLALRHVDAAPRVQAFLEEAIITAGLEHPNIVPVYDLGWSPSFGFYYTMKRLTGRPLCDLLNGLRRGDPEAAASFGLSRALSAYVELCRAVAYSHRRGVIHTDLKPDNIVVGEFGEIVLVDWGMALLLGPAGKSQARARFRGGTPTYMAPEQFTEDGGKLGIEVDIWALGVILYEFLTLQVPFQGKNAEETGMRMMIEPLVAPSERAPTREIPPGIEKICCRALERDASRRYPSVAELLADIEAWLAGTRERMLREERAAQALGRARDLLDRLKHTEAKLGTVPTDRAPTTGPNEPPELHEVGAKDTDSPARISICEELLGPYEVAAKALLRGLNIDPKNTDLQALAGDLYWRVFRLYPPQTGPTTALSERCISLLTGLFARACVSIVEFGQQLTEAGGLREHIDTEATPAGHDTLWLSVAQVLANPKGDAHGGAAMQTMLRRLASLKELPLFQRMPSADLLPVADACHELLLPAGSLIFRQDDPGDTLFVLLSGRVDILRDGEVINTLGAGESLGEIGVLGETKRTASARAATEIRALSLDAPHFRRLVRDNGEIGLAVIQALNDRLQVATRREAALRALTSTLLEQDERDTSET